MRVRITAEGRRSEEKRRKWTRRRSRMCQAKGFDVYFPQSSLPITMYCRANGVMKMTRTGAFALVHGSADAFEVIHSKRGMGGKRSVSAFLPRNRGAQFPRAT